MIYFPSRFDSFPVYDKLNYYLINLDTFFTIWYHFIHVNRNILAKREYPRSCTITDKFVVKKSGIKRGTWGFSKFLLVQLFAFCIVRNRHKLPSYENYPSRSNQRVVPQSRLSPLCSLVLHQTLVACKCIHEHKGSGGRVHVALEKAAAW